MLIVSRELVYDNHIQTKTDEAYYMSKALEFTSNRETRAGQFARGNPLHDGIFPRRIRSIEAIHLNGEDIGASQSTVEFIHGALVEAERARRRGMTIDALSFVAIYNTAIFRGRLARATTTNSYEIADETMLLEPLTPLRLGHSPIERPYLRHSVQPIQTDSVEQLYVHKLGIAGPLCISNLDQAMNMYHCDIYQSYASLTLAGQKRCFKQVQHYVA